MNNRMIPAAVLAVLLMAIGASAQQKTTDYSGSWKLDVAKSDLGERSRIESMDMTVAQTADELSVEKTAKMAEGGMGGGMGRGGGMGGPGPGKLTYSLSGKETHSAGGMGGEVVLKASAGKDGNLKLTQTRNLETQMGAMSIKTVETWQLSEDGKTLTVSSSTETPRGTRNQKMVFTKQ